MSKVIDAQVALAPQRAQISHKLTVQQQQYDVAVRREHHDVVARLGEDLEALKEESKQLGLSYDDYLTLQDRRDEVVRLIGHKCSMLTNAKVFKGMHELAAARKDLEALNLSALFS